MRSIDGFSGKKLEKESRIAVAYSVAYALAYSAEVLAAPRKAFARRPGATRTKVNRFPRENTSKGPLRII
jgi:hypothetical protein